MSKVTTAAPENHPAPAGLRLSVAAAAALAGVHPGTIRQWILLGYVASTRPIARGSGRRYVDRASLEKFLSGGR